MRYHAPPGSPLLTRDAYPLLAGLSYRRITAEPDWHSTDNLTLGSLYGFEDKCWRPATLGVLGELPNTRQKSRSRRELGHVVNQLHAALPFSEAERGWLFRVWEAEDSKGNKFEQWIDAEEDRILDQGQFKTVQSSDLRRRWMAWRRGTEEYAGTRAVRVARHALVRTIELVAPDLHIPKSYRR